MSDSSHEGDHGSVKKLVTRLTKLERPAVMIKLNDELRPRIEEFKSKIFVATQHAQRVNQFGETHLRVECEVEKLVVVQAAVVEVLVEMG